MVVKDLATLRTDIIAAIPDNTSGLVDPVDVRETGLIDTIDSFENRGPTVVVIAAGDQITNDTDAINDAVAIAAALNSPTIVKPLLYFPPAFGYRIEGPIVIPDNIHVRMDGPIVDFITDPNGGQTAIALSIGTGGASFVVSRNLSMALQVERDVLSDWTDGNAGIRLINLDACIIQAASTRFTVGLQCKGDRQGFANNIVTLERIVDNKYGLELVNDGISAAVHGFVNENLFIGGRIAHSSDTKPGIARYGVRSHSIPVDVASGQNYNNANYFLKCNFELFEPTAFPADSVPFLIEHGDDHRSEFCRSEGNGTVGAIFRNDSDSNFFELTHDKGMVAVQEGTRGDNIVTFSKTKVNRTSRVLFDSGNISDTTLTYDATTFHVPRMQLAISATALNYVSRTAFQVFTDEDFTVNTGLNQILHTGHNRVDGDVVFTDSTITLPAGLSPNTKYYVVNAITNAFEVSLVPGGATEPITTIGSGIHTYHSRDQFLSFNSARAVGINVETDLVKQFVVVVDHRADASSSGPFFGGRVVVRLYDFQGELITDDPTVGDTLPNLAHVKGNVSFKFQTDFGSSWKNGNDIKDMEELVFTVPDIAKSIGVFVSGGSANAEIRRIRIYTTGLGQSPNTFTDYNNPTGENGNASNRDPLAVISPPGGVYDTPFRVANHTPGSGIEPGWVLVKSPRDFVAEANLQ